MDLIVCCDNKYGIGKENTLPTYIPEDLKNFKKITSDSVENKQNVVIMGRKTWESIPKKFRPLKNRINIILSRTMNSTDNYIVYNNIYDILRYLKENKKKINKSFVIGGEQIYEHFLKHNLVSKIIFTKIYKDLECDTFFPYKYLNNFKEINKYYLTEEADVYEYEYINKEEQQYLDVLKDVFENGTDMDDRTGVGTRSVFFKTMKFDLRDNTIPLLTTKRVFFRGIVEETLFFLSGSTDVRKLQEKGVHYWDGNTSREFLDKKGLTHLEEYDMGATYSFLYRHFGAEYRGMDKDYTGKGFDQVQYVIDTIKNNPTSRRIMIDLWSPDKLNNCSLPPCQMMYYFYVNEKTNEISISTIIRSSDVFLGLAFNLINATTVLRLVCHATGYKPGDLHVCTNNTHIYNNHFEAVKKQLSRSPTHPFPKMLINTDERDIFKIKYEDIELLNYNPKPNIKAPMAI